MNYSDAVGGDELLRWFGEVPTLHDSEILSLSLRRTGTSELKVHGWMMTCEVDPDGYFVLDKHAVVTFSLEGVMDLQLNGFSGQNVIAGPRPPTRNRPRQIKLLQPAGRSDRHRNRVDTLLWVGRVHRSEEGGDLVRPGTPCG